LMIGAAFERGTSADGMSNMWWLVGAYFLHTMGELCLSPIALSFITRMAPERIVASMMGIYFATTGLANKIAAELGAMAESLGELAIFSLIATVTIGLGLLLMLFSPKINKLTHGYDTTSAEDEVVSDEPELLEATNS
jgi:POT family proton-dependent oligopeptide transporter